ncbi:hypothetical protein L3Q82_024791 [Scortum barcoo]|uniref:Uncharacterized protein n=1 Tax=Scortum barcoo TaxID=214431 RepID=A0ACB8WQ89_9TELE|nr:hypothetical protein L3Q82_024791 [Scortum barcoo]
MHKRGSVVKEECTRERNRECQCRNGFVPWDGDSSTCKCEAGFGLVNGECKECQYGYFTTHKNSPCQKWKECAAGVRFAGSTTQDVICNEGPKSNTSATISPTSSNVASLITRLTSHRPQGGNKTQTMITTTTATTTSAPAHTPKRQSSHSSITGNHIGMAIVMFGVVVLLGLTSVMCKPHITACMEKGPAVQKYAEKCTPTTDARCWCRSGFLCSSEDCSRCVENKCVAGEKLKTIANPSGEYSYQCEPLCHDNEYFDVKENACKLQTPCSILGLAELFPGNKTHNSVCDIGDRHKSNLHFIHVMLGIGFIFLALILLVFLSYACMKTTLKHKEHNNPTNIIAPSTKTNDFHLSKEETGLQLIIQDVSKNSNTDDQLLLEKIIAC